MSSEMTNFTSNENEDRRAYPRLDTRVQVNLVFIPPGQQEAVRREFRSMDVSSGGIRIEIDSPVSKGAFVAVQIQLPDGKEPVDLFAKVVWSREMKQTSRYLVGLQFLSSAKESVDTLKGFLENRLD